MDEYTENFNLNSIRNRLPFNNNRRSNYSGMRKNMRIPFNRANQGRNYENPQNRPRFVQNDINNGNTQSRTIYNDNTCFNKSYEYSRGSQRHFNSDRYYNESYVVNNVQNQIRNYGLNTTRGNCNHQDKLTYFYNYSRKPNYRNEFRGKNNNKKTEKRIEPEESVNLNQRESLIWQLNHDKYECMICVSIIRVDAPTWSCDNCYHIFHVLCIEKWAKSGVSNVVRCPACQKHFDIETSKARQKFSVYRCFCGKVINPKYRRGITPHSCDEICGRSLESCSSYKSQLLGVNDWYEESIAFIENDSVDIETIASSVEYYSAVDLELSPQDELVGEFTESPPKEHDQKSESVSLDQQCEIARIEAIASLHDDNMMRETSSSPVKEISMMTQPDMQSFENPVISCDTVVMALLDIDITSQHTADGAKESQAHSLVIPDDDIANYSLPSQWSCPHSCSLLCHPGPCPPCEALVTRTCHCSRTRITTKCVADARSLVCGSKCDRPLNCRVHRCQKTCHAGPCGICSVRILQRCWCDAQQSREIACVAKQLQGNEDNTRFSCDAICGRLLSCGEHQCLSRCHGGNCQPCEDVPQALERCWCERVTVASLRGGCERTSCLDPRPNCGETCGRPLQWCEHLCSSQCHRGPCPPCKTVVKEVRCQCGRSVLSDIECWVITDIPDSLMCSKPCGKRLWCSRHQCRERCCTRYGSDEHACMLTCGRTLSCQKHSCELQCGHPGFCPICPNVGFEELSCHCGAAISLPPIACGQSPPACSRDCSRPQSCDHPVRHHCHPDSELPCPPCTELTSKQCPGQHRIYHHVPCFRPVATCGLPCGQPLLSCDHHCQRLCHWGPCQPDDGDDDSLKRCSQPCSRPRSGCGHPCAAPCHSGECSPLQAPCEVPLDDWCACGLKCVYSVCTGQPSITGVQSSPVECDQACHAAARLAAQMRTITLHSSYNTIQKHYASFFDEFCKNNFNFVVSIEKIFSDLSESVTQVDSQNQTRYKFPSISIEKARFITKLCSRYLLKPMAVYNFKDNVATVIVEAENNRSFVPKSILSKIVEKKYFKIFKPSF